MAKISIQRDTLQGRLCIIPHDVSIPSYTTTDVGAFSQNRRILDSNMIGQMYIIPSNSLDSTGQELIAHSSSIPF